MEPLENGQIQPLGLSHAIGPPGWRPYFQRGIPSTTKASGGHFLWHPLAPPLPPPPGPRTHCRQIPGTQAPPAGGPGGNAPNFCAQKVRVACLPSRRPWAPLAPPGPPCPPPGPPGPFLAPPPPGAPWAFPGPPWPPLAPPGPPGPPWAPPGPPWPPPSWYCRPPLALAPPWPPLAPWPPPGPPLAPPGPPWPALAGHKKECIPVLAAKAEVGIEGASSKP